MARSRLAEADASRGAHRPVSPSAATADGVWTGRCTVSDVHGDLTDAQHAVAAHWKARAERAEIALDEALDFQRTAFRTIRELRGEMMYMRHRCARAEKVEAAAARMQADFSMMERARSRAEAELAELKQAYRESVARTEKAEWMLRQTIIDRNVGGGSRARRSRPPSGPVQVTPAAARRR